MPEFYALLPGTRTTLAAFLITFALTPVMRAIWPWISAHVGTKSTVGRWSQRRVPVLGGFAIFAGFVIAVHLYPTLTAEARALVRGVVMVFLLGVLDDVRPLPPGLKFVGQLLAAGQLVASGVVTEMLPYGWMNVVVSLLWVVGLTNAFNLIDNMDGLAAGVAAISGLMVFGFAQARGNIEVEVLSAAITGAALGFLPYNYNPATIYMGDSGSMTLGYALASLAIIGNWQHISGLSLTLLAPVLMMLVPIFDTLLVAVARSANGRGFWQGGTDHISHRLVRMGMTERDAVLTLYGASILAGLLSLSLIRTSVLEAALVILGALLICGYAFIVLTRVQVYDDSVQRSTTQVQPSSLRPLDPSG